jgi:hypothetical protein
MRQTLRLQIVFAILMIEVLGYKIFQSEMIFHLLAAHESYYQQPMPYLIQFELPNWHHPCIPLGEDYPLKGSLETYALPGINLLIQLSSLAQ